MSMHTYILWLFVYARAWRLLAFLKRLNNALQVDLKQKKQTTTKKKIFTTTRLDYACLWINVCICKYVSVYFVFATNAISRFSFCYEFIRCHLVKTRNSKVIALVWKMLNFVCGGKSHWSGRSSVSRRRRRRLVSWSLGWLADRWTS